MELKQLRKRCAAKLAGVEMPRPFDLRVFCNSLGQSLGRRIVLIPVQTRVSSPCGLWIEVDGVDYILYEQGTSPLHREHIALHEIGHLLFDHAGAPLLTDEFTAVVVPDLDPTVVRRVLGRSTYTEEEETEAEVLATMVLERADRWPGSVTHSDPRVAGQLRRVASALENPGRDS